jgi:serine/threonine protein phosphatase 1
MTDHVYYAIGDIHGEAALLHELLGHIEDDAARLGVTPRIVLLGDLIDRGPDSRSVVAYAMLLQQAGAIVVRGNHEELMLHAYDRDETIGLYHWATNGGDETIASYEAANGKHDSWKQAIDREHISWLRTLPSIWRDEARKIAFVHGGIDPNAFPACDDDVRLWTRSAKFLDTHRWPDRPELEGLLVVHGHTPRDDLEPYRDDHRINVDTGVCYGGPLTCVALAPEARPRFLHARRR